MDAQLTLGVRGDPQMSQTAVPSVSAQPRHANTLGR